MGVPIYQDIKGEEARTFRIARIEKYIDRKGQIREALAYGQMESEIIVWYDMELIKHTFSKWIVLEVSKWENTRNWNPEARTVSTTHRPNSRGGRGNPRGTDRGRGRGSRGAGSNRGSYNQSHSQYYNQGYEADLEDSGAVRGGQIGQSRRDQGFGRRDNSRSRWEEDEA